MRRAITASIVCFAALGSHADETTFINSDGTAPSAVCIAALESFSTARQQAAELGLSTLDLESLMCNGVPVEKFVSRYERTELQEQTFYAVKPADPSPVTELCVAALNSDQAYQKLKLEHFGRVANLEEKVQCNGRPLRSFVEKYRNQRLTASL